MSKQPCAPTASEPPGHHTFPTMMDCNTHPPNCEPKVNLSSLKLLARHLKPAVGNTTKQVPGPGPQVPNPPGPLALWFLNPQPPRPSSPHAPSPPGPQAHRGCEDPSPRGMLRHQCLCHYQGPCRHEASKNLAATPSGVGPGGVKRGQQSRVTGRPDFQKVEVSIYSRP